MSFSAEVKAELFNRYPEGSCCRFAECSAIFRFCAKSAKNETNSEDFLASMD